MDTISAPTDTISGIYELQQVLSKKPRPQSGENDRKPAVQRAVAEGKDTSFSSGNPFSVQKPRSKPASKPVAGSRKPAGKPAGGSGKRQP
jgi:ATP-dependent RNA helicase RhlE